ncbi:Biotinyl protein ligase (BPL) and lipoyl protein ligase (LPL), catalytic domain, partial [Dillenia turbinata]
MRSLPLSISLSSLSLLNCLSRLAQPLPKLVFTNKIPLSLPVITSSAMDSQSSHLLVLYGKSTAEIDFARSLKENNTLKLADNGEILVLLGSEKEKSSNEESFGVESYMNSLLAKRFGRLLIWSPRLPSTHDIVSQNFCELPVGAVCVADVQYKGRGRSKNLWESPIGCLMFSFTVQMEDGRVVPLLQYVVSLAMTEAIKHVCDRNVLVLGAYNWSGVLKSSGSISFSLSRKDKSCESISRNCIRFGSALDEQSHVESKKMGAPLKMSIFSFLGHNLFQGLPHLDVKIKWPNDLYLNGLKVGGILCTSTYKSKKFNVSAGIGLNIDNEKPSTCLNAVLRELTSVTCQLRREDIIAAFFNQFEILFDLFQSKGFETLEDLYYKTWLHSGQRVVIQENNEDQMVENVVIIQGLTSSGYLLAVGEDNQMYELHPDGNRTGQQETELKAPFPWRQQRWFTMSTVEE